MFSRQASRTALIISLPILFALSLACSAAQRLLTTAAPEPTLTLTDTPKPTHFPTPSRTPAPTKTPRPTSTPQPTNTPDPFIEEVFPQAKNAKQGVAYSCALVLPYVANECAHSGSQGVKIGYLPINGNCGAEWFIHWTETAERRFDLAPFKTLSFWIKGEQSGYLLRVFMTANNKPVQIGEPKISNRWQQVQISIGLPYVEKLAFLFHRSAAETSFCLDDIAFVP